MFKEMEQHQRAIQDLDEAIRLDPQLAVAYTNRAEAYTLLGMDTDAQRDLDRAVELGVERVPLERKIEDLKKQR